MQNFLEPMGKLNRPYLNALGEKVLNVLKSEIKVQLSISYFIKLILDGSKQQVIILRIRIAV
ncbi:MAG: hypothetical protein HWQ35_15630 [Nostoc sp. NMS1]|uniref:hypothetical protein n=1 Tax=unclassified Nostoc TaxID=2593658 RepID=UPI0025EA7DBE|nr:MULTISPECIES: hypothetical protein [unclassified Nostoc]MBN3907929.1 hypothetical protein [Nostoc sp. NMS1]MBN3989411.1 hypothetical protein [Nostoc sp. NMS2]